MRNELSEIKKMEKEAREGEGIISLAQGYPDFPTPWTILEFVKAHLSESVWHQYTLSSGNKKLKEMISNYLGKEGSSYDPSREIIITAGANAGLMATLMSCFQPGDSIALFTPTYASYFNQLGMAGLNPVYIPLRGDKWQVDLDLLADRIRTHHPKAILICNPNNPTGSLIRKDDLLEIARIASQHGLLIICDEVYSYLLYDNENYFSLSAVPELKNVFIKIQSFSKRYAMTGWRVGYVCSSEAIINRILVAHDLMVNCAPSFSQLAAIAALQLGENFVPQFIKEFHERREFVYAWLQKMGEYLTSSKPEGAYFYFIKLQNAYSEFAYDLMKKYQVAVVKGDAFGPFYNGYFRISFAKDFSLLSEALIRISNYFNPALSKDMFSDNEFPMVL